MWQLLPTQTTKNPDRNQYSHPRNPTGEHYLHPFLNRRLFDTIRDSIQCTGSRKEECDTEIYDTASLGGLLPHIQKLEFYTRQLNTTFWKRDIPSRPDQVNLRDLEFLKAMALAIEDFRVVAGDVIYEVTHWNKSHTLDNVRAGINTALRGKLLQHGIEEVYRSLFSWPWAAGYVVPTENIKKARQLERCSSFIGQTVSNLQHLAEDIAAELVFVDKARRILYELSDLPEITDAHRNRRCDDVCKNIVAVGCDSLKSTFARSEYS